MEAMRTKLQASEALTASLQSKLTAADDQVKELTKGAKAAAAARKQAAELQVELEERDSRIAAILEEGKALSLKVVKQEQVNRKLRSSTKSADAAEHAMQEKVAAAEQRIATLLERTRSVSVHTLAPHPSVCKSPTPLAGSVLRLLPAR